MSLIKCENCGKDISSSATTCVHCGVTVIRKIKCQDCGNMVEAQLGRCPNCGAKLFDLKTFVGKIKEWFINHKRAIIILIICVVLIIALVKIVGFVINKTHEKESVISRTANSISKNESVINSSNNNETTKTQTVETKEIKEVDFGDSITTDDWIINLEKYRIAKKIEPARKPSYYTYYEAKEEGHKYLAVDFDFKNLATEEVNSYKMIDMSLKYDNKYSYYSPGKVVEESDGDYTSYDWYFDVEPLKTQKLHYLFDLPADVIDGEGSIDVYINIGELTYKLNVR